LLILLHYFTAHFYSQNNIRITLKWTCDKHALFPNEMYNYLLFRLHKTVLQIYNIIYIHLLSISKYNDVKSPIINICIVKNYENVSHSYIAQVLWFDKKIKITIVLLHPLYPVVGVANCNILRCKMMSTILYIIICCTGWCWLP